MTEHGRYRLLELLPDPLVFKILESQEKHSSKFLHKFVTMWGKNTEEFNSMMNHGYWEEMIFNNEYKVIGHITVEIR